MASTLAAQYAQQLRLCETGLWVSMPLRVEEGLTVRAKRIGSDVFILFLLGKHDFNTALGRFSSAEAGLEIERIDKETPV